MIRLKNILLEQKGSFKDLGPDTFSVMSEPVFTSTVSSYEPELGGFKFNSDNTVATKDYLGKPLTLTWVGNGTFTVKHGTKSYGTMSIGNFESWLVDIKNKTTKLGQDVVTDLGTKKVVDQLKEMGFKPGKDPRTGYDSYVKMIKINPMDTVNNIVPSSQYKRTGLWKCTTAIRVFKQGDNKWMIRAQIIPSSFNDSIIQFIMNREVADVASGASRTGHEEKTTSWYGGEDTEFVYDTPDSVKREWENSLRQAIERVQKVPASVRDVASKITQLESNILAMGGLVGPYNKKNYRWNRLIQLVNDELKGVKEL
jgi:hypothetical protein